MLPPIQRTGEIHFHVAKRLPYRLRLAVSFALMATGLVAQALMLPDGPWLFGLAPVFAGVLLLLPRGYQNTVALSTGTEEWRPARRADIERILAVNDKQKSWDNDLFDITSGAGIAILALLSIAAAVLVGFVATLVRQGLAAPKSDLMIAANALAMLLPFWVTGVRFILKNDRLVIKAKMLLDLHDRVAAKLQDGEEFAYQVQMAAARDKGGAVPRDVKALILFRDAPKGFLGLQMQIAINSVQGTDYPYYYCVLVARPEFGSFEGRRFSKPPAKVIIDTNQEKDASVAVIRQQTTRNSGYHTKPAVAAGILQYALAEARRIVR